MGKQWFKIDTEKWLTSEIRLELTDAQRGRWVDYLALCARHNIDGRVVKQSGIIPLSIKSIAYSLHIDQKTVSKDMKILENLGMIEVEKDKIIVKNWNRYNAKRQDIWRHKETQGDKSIHMVTESKSKSKNNISSAKYNNADIQNNNYNTIFTLYSENFGRVTSHISGQILDLIDDFGEDKLIEALKVSIDNNAKTLSYVRKVLSNGSKPQEESHSIDFYTKQIRKA